MKNMLNFKKISHLYLRQKVDGFTKIIQECLENQRLLKDGKLHLYDDYTDEICLVKAFRTINAYMTYKDFCYIRDGYCFYFTIGYDLLANKHTSDIAMKTDNRVNGIYVYFNEELKEVLVCSL